VVVYNSSFVGGKKDDFSGFLIICYMEIKLELVRQRESKLSLAFLAKGSSK
jgi:hypothetical protein